jgi:hypothetical protein
MHNKIEEQACSPMSARRHQSCIVVFAKLAETDPALIDWRAKKLELELRATVLGNPPPNDSD